MRIKKRLWFLVVGSIAVTCSIPMDLMAQATAVAQISGAVVDSTGAAVAGAQVKTTQTETGFVRTVLTGPDGRYILPQLPVGPYELNVAAQGFKLYVRKGIVLQVNNDIVLNVSLEVGGVSENIQVTANASMVQTQTNAVSQVIEQQRVVDLPLNGRDPTQLILLSGAAVTAPAYADLKSSKNYPTSQTIAVAGGQAIGTYYLLDGADHNDPFTNINLPLPFPDVLQEFSVQTSTVPAQYGGHSGGVVNVVTKSGTNKLHGDLFEFLRNGATNARNLFAASTDTLKRNQFGGTVGAPILKDKLFFFAGYQGTRIRTAPPTSTNFVPTSAVLSGDFSTVDSARCGKARSLTDPATGQAFPGNFIDPSRFNASALAVVKYVPVSSDPCGTIQIAIPNPVNEDQVVGRMDWMQSAKNSVFGRYFIADYRNPGAFDGKDLLLTTRPGVLDRVQSIVLGDTYSLSQGALNSFHADFNRSRINRGGAANLPSTQKDFGLNTPLAPGNVPLMTVSGYFSIFCGVCSQGTITSNIVQATDDVSWVRGRHQFTFGADLIHHQNNFSLSTALNGQYSWNGSATGDALADFLLGRPVSFVSGNIQTFHAREVNFGLYGQDTFRASRGLILNVGLRWQPFFPPYDGGRVMHFDPAALAAGQVSAKYVNAPAGVLYAGEKLPGGSVVPDSGGTFSHLLNLEPRVGIAWDPTGAGRWSLRSSYAIFTDLPQMHFFDRYALGPPWGSNSTILNPAGGFSNPYLGFPGGNPYPQASPPPRDVFFPPGGQYMTLPLHVKPMSTSQWNFSVQRQVGADWLFSATYIGNKSTHRWVNRQLDYSVYIPGNCGSSPCSSIANSTSRSVISLVNPAAGSLISSMILLDDGANAEYDALYFSANHRLSRNFSVLANYTWSHCISESNILGELIGSGYQDPNNRNGDRGNCVTDVRQIFNLSFLATSPRLTGPVLGRLLGHWELAGIMGARTGFWLTPVTGVDASLTNVGVDRPNLVGDSHLADRTIARWFNTAVFRRNDPGTYGNAGAYSLQGPGAFTFDAMITRSFPIGETRRIDLRVESFNLLNHPVLDNPGTNFSSSSFGRILTAEDPRIWQFALKYVF